MSTDGASPGIRRSKAFLLVALAVTMGTLAPSARGAALFQSSSEETTITSTADGAGSATHEVIDAAGASVTCPGSSLVGSFNGESATEILLTATFTGTCKYLGQTATFSMKSCQFSFGADGTLGILTNPAAGTGKSCAEDPIVFSVPSPSCVVTIGPQSLAGALIYENIEPGSVDEITVEARAEGLKYKSAGVGCVKEGERSDGNYTTGNKILTGAHIPMGNLKWEGTTEFHSSLGETAITSTADGTGTTAHQVIDLAGASITCGESNLTGSASSEAIAEIFFTASFSSCKFVGQTATFSMNSCRFSYAANGTLGIVTNPAAGTGKTCFEDPIAFSVPSPACTVNIGPQTMPGALTYKNIKPGTVDEITVETKATGINYESAGAGCPTPGKRSDGNYTTGNRILTGAETAPEMGDLSWEE